MRILIVEDEEDLAGVVAEGLRHEGMAVDVALDGRSALEKASVHTYDVAVLDRDLPVVHGDDVCRVLQSAASSRVLMLTAADSVGDRVGGLNLGADDYLTKPFAFAELIARIRALARRSGTSHPPVLRRLDVELDPALRVASRNGGDLHLTRKEFGVLEALLLADGRVVTSEELLERVWDEHIDPFTTAVRVTIAKLRRKLGDPPLITTVTGVGYQL